jgi:hypothetical protein
MPFCLQFTATNEETGEEKVYRLNEKGSLISAKDLLKAAQDFKQKGNTAFK